MKRFHKEKLAVARQNNVSLDLAIMVLFFLCGIAAGCIFSLYRGNADNSFLFDTNLNEIAQNGAKDYSFWQTYFNLIKYPTIVFLLGFTALGFFVIPITVSVKSFFIAFSVSSVIQALGLKGFWVALAFFGLQTAVSIPCLLLTATFAFNMSKLFATAVKHSGSSFISHNAKPGVYIVFFIILSILLLIFALLDIALTPTLVSIASKNIFQ